MAEYLKAWQCIGCGRLEGPQTCIGICEDRPVQLVSAGDYEDALAQAAAARQRAEALAAVVRQIASITPRPGEFERSYRAFRRATLTPVTGRR
jgi:hypothetical protein